MKSLLLDMLRDEPDDFRRRSRAREYLQARILLALQDSGAFSNWAFVGGTALRFLYGLPRYSEDLDFSLAPPDGNANFEKHMDSVRKDLNAEAYAVEIRTRQGKAVAAAMVKFSGLLFELKLSPHPDEVFMVKVEMDTRPPEGAHTETRLVRRFIMLNLHHYDKASLLAGKVHAILSRQYTKGRDLYDLAWYLSDPDWPEPNLTQLNNALRQTDWSGPCATRQNWRGLVADKLKTLDWKEALRDVSPFLERKQDADLVSDSVILPLLERKGT
jgi:predicted nucleotidyltransferase component of viral defense system